ncbi:22403_t:CDS:2, partial [Racocetra persica]
TRIKLFEPHFDKLNILQNELEKYTICEKHYNQIVAKDNYLNYLKEPSTAINIGIQVEINSNNDLLMQIEALKNSLNTLVAEHSKQ